MQKRWIWPKPLPNEIASRLSGLSPIEQQILYRRNVTSTQAAEMLLNKVYADEVDPFLLLGMHPAVERLTRAHAKAEKVVIYGDYDADGITATALLCECLSLLGFNMDYYIPDRMTEGYGLHDSSLARLRSSGADLIVTVDCGIRALREIENAKKLGLEVIVTDHHQPGDRLPPAVSIIHPQQKGDRYPFKGFAGVGLAYKLAQSIYRAFSRPEQEIPLDLVAIGTVADLAPLIAENRYLVIEGLKSLGSTERPGLQALFDLAHIDRKTINAQTIGFMIGPRINAAGRLGEAQLAVELLLAKNADQAHAYARKIELLNRRRQEMTIDLVNQARSLINFINGETAIILAAHEQFHEGIIGLAATRLMEEFYRPAIVATIGKEYTRGSVRSIPEFHITEALDQCADLLKQYGGHSAAAGFTVATSEMGALWSRLNQSAAEKLHGKDLHPKLELDAEVSFQDLNRDLLDFMDKLEPCGIENHAPILGTRHAKVLSARAVGSESNHLKLVLQKDDRCFDGIAFRLGHLLHALPQHIHAAFRFERNIYLGVESMQLNIQDIEWD